MSAALRYIYVAGNTDKKTHYVYKFNIKHLIYTQQNCNLQLQVCNRESAPHLLSVTDADGPDFSAPYTVSLQGTSKNNWTARMNDTSMFSIFYRDINVKMIGYYRFIYHDGSDK